MVVGYTYESKNSLKPIEKNQTRKHPREILSSRHSDNVHNMMIKTTTTTTTTINEGMNHEVQNRIDDLTFSPQSQQQQGDRYNSNSRDDLLFRTKGITLPTERELDMMQKVLPKSSQQHSSSSSLNSFIRMKDHFKNVSLKSITKQASTIFKKLSQTLQKHKEKSEEKQRKKKQELLSRKSKSIIIKKGKQSNNEKNDPEEQQMIRTIQSKMTLQQQKLVGLTNIKFTVGKEETLSFEKKQKTLRDKGNKYYKRLQREIGSQDQIVIWYSSGTQDFITHIHLSHGMFGHPYFIDLSSSQGYHKVTHPKFSDGNENNPSFILWVQKDRSSKQIITEMNVSYTRQDEKLFEKKEKMEQVDPKHIPLKEFNFGSNSSGNNMYLWVKKTERDAVTSQKKKNLSHLKQQLHEYQELLGNKKDDPILNQMVNEMQYRINKTQQSLKEKEEYYSQKSDVDYTIELLALTPKELKSFQKVFDRIDKDHDGIVSFDEFRLFVMNVKKRRGKNKSRSTTTTSLLREFSNHIFKISTPETNSDDDSSFLNDRLDFGQLIRAVAMFGMFSSCEILKFMFSIFDKNGKGIISNQQFLSLLGILHPFVPKCKSDESPSFISVNKSGRVARTLKEFDLPSDEMITFEFFLNLHKRFPNLLYPAFEYQEQIRKKFLGTYFWKHKLYKYQSAKNKVLLLQQESLDEVEEEE